MTHSEKARELFAQGYNCSQAVFAAFCDVTELNFETAVKIASSFGGGMGGMREVCGAVTGMFMVAGMLYGCDNPKEGTQKAEHNARIRELTDRFRQIHGSIICGELLGLFPPRSADAPIPAKRPCAETVANAAKIMDDYIAAHQPQ